MKRVRADLVAERDLLLRARQLGQLLAPLLLGLLVEPRPENAERRVAVAQLRPFVLTLHDDARGQVRDAHRRVRGVHALPARAGRAINVDAQLVVANVDLDVVDFRHDGDGGEARLSAARGVERRDPDQPVDPGFAPQESVRVLARDLDRRGLDPRFFSRQEVDDIRLEARTLTPAEIHAHQHLRPVL